MADTFVKGNNRDIGVDITRIVAFVSVPGIHFFLNSGYYDMPVIGKTMYGMTVIRTYFMTCVPLFMILTGYLYANKTIDITKESLLKFYKKVSKVVSTYLVATLLLLLMMKLVLNRPIGGIKGLISNLLSYAQYSWYVNMYIGMFLLIPFLNSAWNMARDKSARRVILLVMLCTTTLPTLVNGTHTLPIGQIVPNYWVGLYPLTYYYIGGYIKKDVDIKHKSTIKILTLLTISVVIFGMHNIWISKGQPLVWGEWNNWQGYQNVIDSTLVFLLINSINFKNNHSTINKCVSKIANLTFGAYILSHFGDLYIYPYLNETVTEVTHRIYFFPLTVGFTVISSLILSEIVDVVITVIKDIKKRFISMR